MRLNLLLRYVYTHGHFYIQKYFCHQEKEKKNMSRTCQSNPKCVKLLVNQKPTKEHGAQSRVKKKALNPCKQGNYSPSQEIF